MSLEENVAKLREMNRSERLETLFGVDFFDYQQELVNQAEENDIVHACPQKGRQVGATFTAALIAADYALTHAGEDVLIAAPFQDTADEMFRECKEHLKTLCGGDLEKIGVISDNKREWEFDNGTRIISATLGKDGVGQRGKNPRCVIVDEAAFVPDVIFEEVIEPFFLTHDTYEFYMFSTPSGKSGYYYEKVKFDDSWFSPHWPSRINPMVDTDWLDEKREEKDELTFDQEYRGEFLEEGENYLPRDLIMSCVDDSVEGEEESRRVLAVDVARSGSDHSVFYDMDEHGVTRQIQSEESSTLDGVLGRIKAMHESVGYEVVLVDENGLGGGVVDFGAAGLGDVVQPFTFSTKSKQNMYQTLKKHLESNEIVLPQHKRLIEEATSLQSEFTQHGYLKLSHPPGGHDDYIDACAMANWASVRVARSGIVQSDDGGISFL